VPPNVSRAGSIRLSSERHVRSYSWALVYTHQASQANGQELVAMLDWLTHTGQAYAAANGYVPLPQQIQQLAHTMLQQITGPNGTHLLS
jgi:ABC-type phosphate transport system substrate-binding protein